MILLLKLVIISWVWCTGVFILTQEGMALHKLRVFGESKIKRGWIVYEPLWVCIWCMPSIHCIVAYLFAYLLGIIVKFELILVWTYPLVAMASSFLNGFVWSIYEMIEAKTKYYVNAEKLKYFEIRDKKNEYNKKQSYGKSN